MSVAYFTWIFLSSVRLFLKLIEALMKRLMVLFCIGGVAVVAPLGNGVQELSG
jgi:hypothetical protein